MEEAEGSDGAARGDPAPHVIAARTEAHSPFPIVGIGASAGGLDALNQLLGNLPVPAGMAFIVVQHLDPHHESRLTELLSRASRVPVVEARDGMAVRAEHTYVIPPNTNLALMKGLLRLTPRGDVRLSHHPVDHLFRSLAEHQQMRAIGIVLSGSGSDGTLGLAEIKAVGGITFAQDERTAKQPGMPRSAIDSGAVDFVLPPADIGRRLAEISSHPHLAAAGPDPPLDAEPEYQRILKVVRAATRVDFAHYRDTTIRRRISRRMALHSLHSLAGYADVLEQDRGEVEALYRDLLINVTSFFRDPDVFEALKSNVLPQLLKGKSVSAPIRVWVPGCSAGQEAYSIAMAIWEYFDDQRTQRPVHIFATDLSDPAALDKARAGLYPESIEGEVTPDRLRRFFKREDHLYRIDKSIRDACVFARQNVSADPPFSHVDLISCRNVLIYMAPALQKRVLPTFHYALNMPGFLLLGAAETIGEFTDLFEVTDRQHKIYAKRVTAARPTVSFAVEDYKSRTVLPGRRAGLSSGVPGGFQREADRIVLARYAPPGVLVNENLDIVQFRGRTTAYLEAPPGEPTINVLKMAREGLFVELRSALTEAQRTGEAVVREHVRMRDGQRGVHEITLRVLPIRLAQGSEACFMILFDDGGEQTAPESRDSESATEPSPARSQGLIARLVRRQRAPGADIVPPPGGERELAQLRQELAATKEYLQSLAEQQDAVNEELRSANEEVLSSNEELQSTNEELETAKEELQSANEELTTVNEQLQHRNVELNQLTNDLTNLLTSIGIPVVMVSADLRIRRITQPARRVMNLLPTDIGRPIDDIKGTVAVPDLPALIGEVIDLVTVREREVQDRDGRWFSVRVHPYRTAGNKIDGAVIVLLDIDQVKRVQGELVEQAELLRRQASLIDLSQDATIVRDAKNAVVFWNRGAEAMYGWPAAEAHGKNLYALLRTRGALSTEKMNAQIDREGAWTGELTHTRRDGGSIVVDSKQVVVRNETGVRTGVLEINRDITERKHGEDALVEADRRKNEFLAVLGHELRNPLSAVLNVLHVFRRSGADGAQLDRARQVLGRQAGQLLRIVDDLLDLARIVQGKLEMRVARVAVGDMIESAIETARPHIDAAGHVLDVDVPRQALYVEADAQRISQVVANLLINAAKYTQRGGRIQLSAVRDALPDAPHGAVTVKVRDNGAGIAVDLLPHIFTLFTQGSPAEQRAGGGLGVGLAVAKTIVEAHGGSISVTSAGPGSGSEFVVRLPLTLQLRTAHRAAREATEQAPQSRRILIVDDDHDAAESLRILLEMFGHEVRVRYDGEDIPGAVVDFQPDAALIDLDLRGTDGYEVARRLRSAPALQGVTLIAQTGFGSDESRVRSHEAGFSHHLVKPLDLEALMFVLNEGKVTQ